MPERWLPHRHKPVLPDSAQDVLHALELRVRPDFRRAVVFGVLALVAMYVGHRWGHVNDKSAAKEAIAYGSAVAVLVLGVVATRTAAREIHRFASSRAGAVAATPMRFVALVAGYLISAVVAIGLIGVDLSRLLVGGAVTGVILGVAAQQVLGNFFAGLVLQFTRPFVPGDYVKIRAGALGGPHQGSVVSMGLIFTVMDSTDGLLNIPNSAILAGAVGPVPRPAPGVQPALPQPAVPQPPPQPSQPLAAPTPWPGAPEAQPRPQGSQPGSVSGGSDEDQQPS
jgi:Mechanosensitive ion channel